MNHTLVSVAIIASMAFLAFGLGHLCVFAERALTAVFRALVFVVGWARFQVQVRRGGLRI